MISIYVAISSNGVIGKENGLPWYLPSDLKRFKEITTGHPVVMGRKTYESIGRPLPGRTNIVITHNKGFKAAGCEIVNSVADALKLAESSRGGEEIFVIGGSSIYKETLPVTDKIYLTRVAASIDGDIFFELDESQWRETFSEKHSKDQKNQYDYEFVNLERK